MCRVTVDPKLLKGKPLGVENGIPVSFPMIDQTGIKRFPMIVSLCLFQNWVERMEEPILIFMDQHRACFLSEKLAAPHTVKADHQADIG